MMKKIKRVVVTVILLAVLVPAGWFFVTRFCMARYAISPDWASITFHGDTYTPLETTCNSFEEGQAALLDTNRRTGKTIGIGVFPQRTFDDLIWPVWIMECDGDTARDRIFVRGLMDAGTVYGKAP
jgi:hypothetical protein